MKKASILLLILFLMTGCNRKTDQVWDQKHTSKGSNERSGYALWEQDNIASLEDPFPGPNTEDFLALNDEDLKSQFKDGTVPQAARGLGEKGVPSVDAFAEPRGELASVFKPLFFNTDDHILRGKSSVDAVRRMAVYLKAHPKASLIVQGHCDARGPEAYNMALGTRRANYVRSLLVKEGVNPDQLHAISFGKERPFAIGQGKDVWAQNRRAHFLIHAE